jgi:3-oxoacyl-[acyl-carrier-protein] synthase I
MGAHAARAVAIIGVGARTPVGLSVDASAAAIRGALSVIRQHPYFVDKEGEPIRTTRDALLPVELDATDRCVELARSAASEAVRPLLGHRVVVDEIPTIVGLPEPRPGRSADLERLIATDLTETAGKLGVRLDVQTLACGHSAGLMALDVALKRIGAGEIDLCLIGGVDSYIEGETLEWLDQNRQLMSGANRSGFPPGEAAGFCLLAASTIVRQMSLTPLAGITAAFTSVELNRIKTETICIGEGLTAAIRGACAAPGTRAGKVEQTWCDMNGERYRSTEYTYALLRTHTLFERTRVAHPADCWGDVGAASGPLFAGLAVQSWSRGYATGPRALLWTSSESGHRAAAVLEYSDGVGAPSV